MKHLYFCRHGLSELNKAGLWAGSTETPLTSEGREQAKLAGKHARGLGIDHIIASPMERAYETAQIIAGEIGLSISAIELNKLLVERHLGILENTPYDPTLNVDDLIEEVETLIDLEARVKKALRYIKSLPHDTILVVSHGATGRMFRHTIDPSMPFWSDNPKIVEKLRFPNAEIVKLV